MYKINFKLKQHTPLIHFQAEQAGATLRASELKPKLDRFIITKLGEDGGYEAGLAKAKSNDWLLGNENEPQPSLNYRLRITSSEEVQYYFFNPLEIRDREKNRRDGTKVMEYRLTNLKKDLSKHFGKKIQIIGPSPYFANADKIKWKKGDQVDFEKFDEIKLGIQANGLIVANIKSPFNELITKIKSTLTEFFLLHNFGTRASKGFGSFTLEEIENQNQKNINEALVQQHMQFVSARLCDSVDSVFKTIDYQYKLLKSGINFGTYSKSELFKYFVEPPTSIRWEKRKIKQELKRVLPISNTLKQNHNPIDYDESSRDYEDRWEDLDGYNYKYIRALLGLMENWEFALDRGKATVKVKHLKENREIARFQSPITFKPINGRIFVHCNLSYKLIEGEQFEFSYKKRKLETLSVPTGFDLLDFMDNHFTKSGVFEQILNK